MISRRRRHMLNCPSCAGSPSATLGYAVLALTDIFERNSVADVTERTCAGYAEKRGRSARTVLRELGVLRASFNYAHKGGRITRSVAVEFPVPGRPKVARLARASDGVGRGFETIALAQRRSLVIAVESDESIGGGSGGLPGPAVISSENFFVAGEGRFAQGECFGGAPSGH